MGVVGPNISAPPAPLRCLAAIYRQQLKLRNLATFNLTGPEMVEHLIDLMVSELPSLNRTALFDQLDFKHQPPIAHNVPLTYNLAKNQWKYGASRGIWKTPTFMINDVAIGARDSARPGYDPEHYLGLMTKEQWIEILDAIVGGPS